MWACCAHSSRGMEIGVWQVSLEVLQLLFILGKGLSKPFWGMGLGMGDNAVCGTRYQAYLWPRHLNLGGLCCCVGHRHGPYATVGGGRESRGSVFFG